MIGHILNSSVDRRQTVAFRETPRWKTSQVVEFANQIMDSKDFSDVPILADLIEGEGFEDQNILTVLRKENPSQWNKWKIIKEVAQLAGGKYQEAVETIKDVGLGFENVMDDMTEYGLWDDYLVDGGRYEGFHVGEDQWGAYDLLTGYTPKENQERSYVYSCSC